MPNTDTPAEIAADLVAEIGAPDAIDWLEGKLYVWSLGHHIVRAHDMTVDDYRDRFGLARGEPLTSPATRARFVAAISATISDGKLDAHYAGNAGRASEAATIGAREYYVRRAEGLAEKKGAPSLPRAAIEAVVQQIEAGAKVATAVKRGSISYSAYHAGLARHPDLAARHEAARSGKR